MPHTSYTNYYPSPCKGCNTQQLPTFKQSGAIPLTNTPRPQYQSLTSLINGTIMSVHNTNQPPSPEILNAESFNEDTPIDEDTPVQTIEKKVPLLTVIPIYYPKPKYEKVHKPVHALHVKLCQTIHNMTVVFFNSENTPYEYSPIVLPASTAREMRIRKGGWLTIRYTAHESIITGEIAPNYKIAPGIRHYGYLPDQTFRLYYKDVPSMEPPPTKEEP